MVENVREEHMPEKKRKAREIVKRRVIYNIPRRERESEKERRCKERDDGFDACPSLQPESDLLPSSSELVHD